MATKEKVEPQLLMPKPTAHLSATDADIPQLKNWEVDKVYTLEVTAKLVGLNRDRYTEGKPLEGRFEVQSIKSDDDDPGIKGFDSVPVTRRTKGSYK